MAPKTITIYRLAREFGVTRETLRPYWPWLNDLEDQDVVDLKRAVKYTHPERVRVQHIRGAVWDQLALQIAIRNQGVPTPLVSLAKAARALKIKPATLVKKFEAGAIPAFKDVNGRWQTTWLDLDASQDQGQ